MCGAAAATSTARPTVPAGWDNDANARTAPTAVPKIGQVALGHLPYVAGSRDVFHCRSAGGRGRRERE